MIDAFHDDGRSIYDFGGQFLVRCPRCDQRAVVIGIGQFPEPRLTCEYCGLARVGAAAVSIGGSIDWYFGQPLWLQVECAGHTLWAYNLSHIEFLENLVAAKLRLRDRPVDTTYVNKRLASRLPPWMLSAKNRDAVLRGLEQLRDLTS